MCIQITDYLNNLFDELLHATSKENITILYILPEHAIQVLISSTLLNTSYSAMIST